MTTKITEKNISNIANRFIQWQSVITADGSTATSAVAGQGYLIDTTSATHTINLPSSASNGDSIVIKDYAGTFNTNNLTIGRNGHNIQGVANDSLISSNRASLTLVYIDSTKGWVYTKESNVADLGAPLFTSATGGTIATSGDFKIHTFTGDGCFVVSQLGNSPVVPTGGPSNVDYLVVAGGGGGGTSGAGAGGYRTTFPSPGCNAGSFPITSTTYSITVGGGGTGAQAPGCCTSGVNGSGILGSSGSNSVFSTITSTGGGGGSNNNASFVNGISGGSGSGATLSGTAGSGNTPPTSPSQGNNGGTAQSPGLSTPSGGGGGAGGVGGNGSAPTSGQAGTGGAGSPNSITGSSVTYAGGGGGGMNASGTGGPGGSGGGGSGSNASPSSPIGGVPNSTIQPNANGGTNTGGGGGGVAANGGGAGGTGGSGIVIIRYKFQ